MDEPPGERNDDRPASIRWTGSEDPMAAKVLFVVLALGALGVLMVATAIL